MTAQTMFATCALPGCRLPVGAWGDICPDCQAAFGDMLHQATDAPPVTEDVLAERDQATASAYLDQLRAEIDAKTAKAHAKAAAGPERKPMQVCWMCEERRTCTATPQGWECDRCSAIT